MEGYYFTYVNSPYAIKHTTNLDELVTMLYNNEAQFLNDDQIITGKLDSNYNDQLRKVLSKYASRIPLYDINSNHVYLVLRENVYNRVYYSHYRHITDEFINDLKKSSDPIDLDNYRILQNYDIPVLKKTFNKVFYESFQINNFATQCKRPSFSSGMTHINPYYKINELYFLAKDWKLITAPVKESEISEFCSDIASHDIPAKTLVEHQIYIYDNSAIGLVKHYTLFGSYYMNSYLRASKPDKFIRDTYLESQIDIMKNLISNAPALSKPHTVYRLVDNDSYLSHLQVGDIYVDPSFTSVTRNPFYYIQNNTFGNIMLKIKLPSHITGLGLSVEAYSNFPNEEEFVLMSNGHYKLISIEELKTTDDRFYSTFGISIIRKYEFELISVNNDKIDISGIEENIKLVNLKNEDLSSGPSKYISRKLDEFRINYLNYNNQFKIKIGKVEHIMTIESYQSTGIYKPYFYYAMEDGIMLTVYNPDHGNISLMIELGPIIHVNYYFKYSLSDSTINLTSNKWIEWLSLFTATIGASGLVIHSDYTLNKVHKSATYKQKQMATRYTYSKDIYEYMKNKSIRFSSEFINVNYDTFQLDLLFDVPVTTLIKPTDHTELYRLAYNNQIENLGDLYLFVVEKEPQLIEEYVEYVSNIYQPRENPFINVTYTLNAWLFLYSNKLISTMPTLKKFKVSPIEFTKLVKNGKVHKFTNRLRGYLDFVEETFSLVKP